MNNENNAFNMSMNNPFIKAIGIDMPIGFFVWKCQWLHNFVRGLFMT